MVDSAATPARGQGSPGTALHHSFAAVPVAGPYDTAADVLDRMREHSFDSAAVVAVLVGETLAGLVTIERLLAAPGAARMDDLMDPDPPVVHPDTAQERAAWKAVQHGEPGLAVVDGHGRFRGLIAPQQLLAVLLHEHDQDMARIGGFAHSVEAARASSGPWTTSSTPTRSRSCGAPSSSTPRPRSTATS